MQDIHSHILYGVDDGAPDKEASVAMLQAARAIGIDRIIATPHMRKAYRDEAAIRAHYEELVPEAEKLGIEMKLGFEMHCDMCLDYLPRLRDFCLAGTETILLEFDFQCSPGLCERIIDTVQRADCDIIIAHPERYECVANHPEVVQRWLDVGCRLQLDGRSLNGGLFDKTAKAAKILLKSGVVDFIATDAHRPENYREFADAVRKLDLNLFDNEI